jgi:hypothetical protein
MQIKSAIIFIAISMSIFSIAVAGDTIDERNKAAERYLNVVPMKNLLDDLTIEMAKSIPGEKREQFIDLMNKRLDVDQLEKITKNSIVKIFTADEINALADFYESEVGKSAMKKFGIYMGEIMPHIQKEIIRAGQEAAKSI